MSNGGAGHSSRWLPWHVVAVFGFLYLPIVTLIVYSFNGSGVGGFLAFAGIIILFGRQYIPLLRRTFAI